MQIFHVVQRMGGKASRSLFLFAFDFDHTLVDGNSDVMVQNAYGIEPVFEYLSVSATEHRVTTYKKEGYLFHYPRSIKRKDYHKVLNNIAFVPGMRSCVAQLKKLGAELIVISDANTYFIEHTLRHHKLNKHFSKVFSNPAHFDDNGRLIIMPYMDNLDCNMSSRNLCKGKALEDYIRQRKEEGQSFAFVVFAGDGINDFCPMYRLGPNDLACGREGYSIGHDIAKKASQRMFLKADLMFWRDGEDIVEAVVGKMEELGCLEEDKCSKM